MRGVQKYHVVRHAFAAVKTIFIKYIKFKTNL